MRIHPFLLFLLFFTLEVDAQNLQNTEWFSIKAERKDGSKIVDRSNLGDAVIGYTFLKNHFFTSVHGHWPKKQSFRLENNILTVGVNQAFHIETFNDSMLVIVEIPKDQLPDDKINRLQFINSKYYLKYLTQNNLITITADTLVCNNRFFPIYEEKSVDSLLLSYFPYNENDDRTLYGYFILSADGDLNNVHVTNSIPKGKVKKEEIEKFISALKSTNSFWKIPQVNKPLNLKVDFACGLSRPSLFINPKISVKTNNPNPSTFDLAKAVRNFDKGVVYLNKGEFEKAVTQFSNCIQADSLYLDGYYNKAYALYKLNNLKSACDTWRKLKDMGQKPGEDLYRKNCN